MKYLLNFFDEHQSRRIKVVENTLTNRRTVSNLFWAQQYGILHWTGADRPLDREQFERDLRDLADQGFLTLANDQAQLTSQGVVEQEELHDHCYRPSFYSWYWLGNVNKIEERLLLAIQVVSELTHHQRRYVPVSDSTYQLQWIRNWLYRELRRTPQLNQELLKELLIVGNALASQDQRAANLFSYMMVGFQSAGWTLNDASQELHTELIETQFIKTDIMLAVGAFAASSQGILHRLLADLLRNSPLSGSVERTMTLFKRGTTITKIAQLRRLKVNTVREHLLEAAIVEPDSYPWRELIPEAVRQRLKDQYGQLIASDWQFNGEAGDSEQFFYFRLYQIIQGGQHDS